MNIVNVGYDSTNYYVLAESAPILLIDAGWPNTLPKFQAACKRMGIDLTRIPYVLCTHYHPDHAGLAQELKRMGAKLLVTPEQVASITPLAGLTKPTDHFTPIDLADNVVVHIEDSRAFLAKLGISGEIVHTPGHSDDSVTLVLDTGEAFTGDLTAPMMVGDDPADPLVQSWAKLRAMRVTTIYPGHGPAGKLQSSV